VDGDSGTGTARNARLEFMGVPIFYTPWISYPVTTQRKTGFLLPNISRSDSRGLEFDLPYYLNLAPNYDATLTPRVMTKRGFELDSDFRYLLPNHDGDFRAELLPHDDVTSDTRYLLAWKHQSLPADNWRLSVDARTVSDKQYFEDLYGTLGTTSQTFLERRVDLQYLDDYWSVLLRVQDYQTLDEIIGPTDKPYVRLPELAARGDYTEGPLGLAAALDSEFTWFQRAEGVTGARLHVAPEVSWPLRYRGVSLEPALVFDYTHYALRDTAPGAAANPTRTVPIYSVDLSTVFERLVDRAEPWLQTIEPRVEYVRIPFRQQDDLPVFDTTEPDFNLVQLFRKNRFVGLDRIGDTNQLSVGLTTRLLDAGSGTQILSATLGQARYFTPLSVTLPGGAPSSDAASNYVAELGLRLQPRWNLNLGYQWNTDTSRTELAEARVQYRPDRARVLSLAYRYRADTLDEIEVAGAWPVTDRWNLVGRYDYSVLDHQQLEALVGVEYQNCCWGVRLTARRHLASRDGSSDTSVALQLVLKGLGNPTEPADRILENGILGYDRD
jgi:LPS-assembly protein